jgi:hypothetical protein
MASPLPGAPATLRGRKQNNALPRFSWHRKSRERGSRVTRLALLGTLWHDARGVTSVAWKVRDFHSCAPLGPRAARACPLPSDFDLKERPGGIRSFNRAALLLLNRCRSRASPRSSFGQLAWHGRGLISEPCARLRIETIGRPLGGRRPDRCGKECRGG